MDGPVLEDERTITLGIVSCFGGGGGGGSMDLV